MHVIVVSVIFMIKFMQLDNSQRYLVRGKPGNNHGMFVHSFTIRA